MKRLKFHRAIVAIAMMLIGWLPSLAHDFEVDGIFYDKLNSSEVAVTYKGDSYRSYSNEYFGDVVIPSSVNYNGTTYSVTSIGDNAFSDCYILTGIEIPNSVTKIGDYAFYNCIGLTSIEIPNSITAIGEGAFSSCYGLTSIVVKEGNSTYDSRENCNAIIETATNKLITGCKNSFIPNSVNSIGNYAFHNCAGLTSIKIPNSVTSIGRSAFYNCNGLTSIVIGNSVTSIGDYAFHQCSSMTSIEIPNSVTSIGESAFYNCKGLTSIEIPNSVTSIGNEVFANCTGLTSVVIGNNVTSIGDDAFYNCTGLTSVVIGNNVTSIGDDAFDDCIDLISVVWNAKNCSDFTSSYNSPFKDSPNITSFMFGDSVEHIPAYLCSGMLSMTSIEIPNSVTSIGDDAFYNCSGLTSIVIGNSVTSIGKEAFRNCWRLTDVVIGKSVTSIGDYAFYNCTGLTSIEIPNSVTSVGSSAFSGCSKLTSVEIGNSVTSIGEWAFSGCSDLTSVVWNAINYSDFTYDDIPFRNSTKITSFTFGDSVEHIPAYLCYRMYKLTDIEIPNSVSSIGDYAFYSCDSLTSIKIPNSVTNIGDYAFYGCIGLTSIKIPNSVTSIGSSAFSGCSSLININVETGNPTYDSRENCNAIIETATNMLIAGCQNTIIPNSVTSIGEWAFNGCSSLTSIEIPNSVTSIGEWAFSDCIGLTSIDIPNNVTSIGSRAFSGCTGLTSVVIPNGVTSIGDYAFYGCIGLTSIKIPNSVTSIGSSAFSGCSSLTSIEIPNRVTSIGLYAFNGCSSLASVVIGKSVTSIGSTAFYGCSNLTSVVWNAINCSDFSHWDLPFKESPNITSFTFGDSVEHIPVYLCYGMSGLTSIEIPNSVTSIGECAFSNGEKLTIVVLGNSVTSIGKDAFKGCDNIKKIESKATKAPTIENEDQFSENVYANADLFVPIGYEDNYKYAYAWSEFHNIKGKDFSVKATSISLDKNEVSLKPTQTVVLTETIQPYDTSNKKVTWSSSDESVATIDANGLVTAVAVGEATITATTTDGSNLSATCKVTVVPTLAVSIELDQTEASVEEKSELQLTATILPEHATNKEVAWSSSDKWVATVDNTGLVTIHSAGEVIITATTTDGTNLSATCRINVYSGIDGVNGDNVIVATIGDNIVVKNAKLGSVVNVYASNGALVASEEATDGSVVVEAPVKGVYVVKVGKQTVKVII